MRSHRVDRSGPLAVHVVSAADDLAHITVSVAGEGEGTAWAAQEGYRRVGKFLTARRMQVVHERVFGSLSAREDVLGSRAEALRECGVADDGPVTYVEGRPIWGNGLAGAQLMAVRPARPDAIVPVQDGGVTVGRRWERSGAEFTVLQNVHGLLHGTSAQAARAGQAERMFEEALRVLRTQRLGYGQVARTWIYLADILDWYDEFNLARNSRYTAFGLMPDSAGDSSGQPVRLPASTGIEGRNSYGAACIMDLLAVAGGPTARVSVVPMANVKQADAYRYGSAFSRGVCIREPDLAQIQISGTAAIDEQGRSLSPNDARAQVLWTLDSVQSLISQEGAALSDMAQGTLFLKRAADYPACCRAIAERGLADMPVVCVQADVCREELLFEMDGVAVLARRD
jgi:enamine deaminase RidA (YjgF/YER057c/UK114 family)